jgi:hypothetical protein
MTKSANNNDVLRDLMEDLIRHSKEVDQRFEENDRILTERFKKTEELIKELSKDVKANTRQWGNLANRLGTLVEDFFIPSIDIVIEKRFDCKVRRISPRLLERLNGNEMEIDILVESNDKRVFIIEVKSKPDKIDYIDYFREKLDRFLIFFPEYTDYKLIPIYAGLNMNQSTINKLTNENIYAMIIKGDMLEIPNYEEVNT